MIHGLRMRTPSAAVALAIACLVVASACEEKSRPAQAAPPTPVAPAPRARHVAVLVTGHEMGRLVTEGPRLAGQLEAELPEALLLSTGDTFAGQAISAHFFGDSTAELMKALQYRAQALGNHDLDLGLDTLQRFRKASGVAVLAANLKDRPNAELPLRLEPFVVVERGGVKVGVVGLTSQKTVRTTVAGRTSGLELVPTEAALPPALDGARRAGAELVVVLVDDCFDELARLFEAHADWQADLVAGARCEAPATDGGAAEGSTERQVREVHFLSTGDHAATLATASFTLPAAGPRTAKFARLALDAQAPEAARLASLRAGWQARLDQDLGAVVGYSATGVKADDPRLRAWVAAALRDETKSDAALIDKKGVRAELPKGPVTAAHVYSMLPFENVVMVMKVKGEVLQRLRANPEAVLLLPPKLDPAKEYQLVTTEYLYFGGDGLGLEDVAPDPEVTGQAWQTPVIAWLTRLGSSEQQPLEKLAK